jgi:hypothetical protein
MSGRPDFDAGDLVVCVDDGPLVWKGSVFKSGVVRGRVYRVDRVICDSVTREWGVLLTGIRSIGTTGAFYASRFRKIDRADDSFIQTLAACKPRERVA